MDSVWLSWVSLGQIRLCQVRLDCVDYLVFQDREEDERLQIVASAVAAVVVDAAAAVAVVADDGDDGWPGRLRGWTSTMKELEMTDLPRNWIYLRAQETICRRTREKSKMFFF